MTFNLNFNKLDALTKLCEIEQSRKMYSKFRNLMNLYNSKYAEINKAEIETE